MIASITIFINFKEESEGLEPIQALEKLEDIFIPELKKMVANLEAQGIKVIVDGTQSNVI